MSPQNQRQTFISYSRVNKDFASKLAKELKEEGFSVWFDLMDIPTGARWDDEVENALHESEIFLIILTPDSIASENVKDEIGYAIDHGTRILPILLENCEIPLRLRRFQYVDFTKLTYKEGIDRAEELLKKFVEEESIPLSAGSGTDASENAYESVTTAPTFRTRKAKVNPYMIGGAAFLGIAILATVFFTSGKGAKNTPSVETTPTIQEAALVMTEAPVIAAATSTPQPTEVPTETLTPAPQPFYTEDFNGDLSHWTTFVTAGDQNKLKVSIDSGNMIFDLSGRNLWAYSVLNDFTYGDVKLEAVAVNRGLNDNDVSLICRYTEGGWYEFNIANDGTYTIFAYDSIIKYDPLADGGSTAIKSGQSTNKYTAICKGNTLSLLINDQEVRTVTVNRYNYDKGKVGLSVSSFYSLPIKVEFESLKISKP